MARRSGIGGKQVLCVVAPLYNEAAVVDLFYKSLTDALSCIEDLDCRMVFVDDGSSDGTLEKLNVLAACDERVNVYSLSRNFGHQVALSAGLDQADGDAVLMMDSDLQHPPAAIGQLVKKWREGCDVVSAVRRDTRDASLLKRLTSSVFYRFMNYLSDTPIVPGAADFCLLSRRAHRALCAMPERHRFLRGMVSWIGFQRALVPFDAPGRVGGSSKYTTWKMLSLALDAFFSFSATPMKLATRVGAGVMLLGVVYFGYILVRHFMLGDLVPGWGSLICTTLIVGGLLLMFLGVIGEYVARLFEESKRRPLYFFKQTPAKRKPLLLSRSVSQAFEDADEQDSQRARI